MNIVTLSIVAIVSCILSLAVRQYNKELSLLISIGAVVVILLSVIDNIILSIDSVTQILAKANIDSEYVSILLKVVGICFVTEFTCDCTKEAGLYAMAGNIALAGKVLVLMTSMPMFMSVIDIVTKLTGGEFTG